MLKCEVDNPKIFKNLFKGLSCLFGDLLEVQIKCNNKGMVLEAINKSHTVLSVLNIEKNFFNMYHCEEETILNIDLEELFKSLNRMYKDDRLVLESDESYLSVIFQGEAKRTFKIKLEEGKFKPVNMPKLREDREKCELPTKLLIDMVKEVDNLGNRVTLCLDSDYFKLKGGSDFRQFSGEYLHGEKVKESHSSSFSADYIKDCLKSNISDIVELKIGNFAPLNICFNIENLFLEFIIAPRMDEV